MSESYAALLAEYDGRERIPLRELGERLGMDRAARSYAVTSGVIDTAGRAGLGGGYVIDHDEAVRLIVAAALAVGGAVAIVAILRGIKGAGLSPGVLAAALPQ
jgi:hypothetical protein